MIGQFVTYLVVGQSSLFIWEFIIGNGGFSFLVFFVDKYVYILYGFVMFSNWAICQPIWASMGFGRSEGGLVFMYSLLYKCVCSFVYGNVHVCVDFVNGCFMFDLAYLVCNCHYEQFVWAVVREKYIVKVGDLHRLSAQRLVWYLVVIMIFWMLFLSCKFVTRYIAIYIYIVFKCVCVCEGGEGATHVVWR